jgi:hypothetical protein
MGCRFWIFYLLVLFMLYFLYVFGNVFIRYLLCCGLFYIFFFNSVGYAYFVSYFLHQNIVGIYITSNILFSVVIRLLFSEACSPLIFKFILFFIQFLKLLSFFCRKLCTRWWSTIFDSICMGLRVFFNSFLAFLLGRMFLRFKC